MPEDKKSISFLSQYPEPVPAYALELREIIFKALPNIIEQLDVPAKMIGYVYGQRYADMICTIIPSKKGLKLGFAYGVDLPDPHHLLEGTGKISRYVVIKSERQIKSLALKRLLEEALAAYRQRMSIIKRK